MTSADNSHYLQMLKTGRCLQTNEANLPELRVAFLADHAAQQMTLILKAAIKEAGFFPEIYEADYGAAAFEAFDRTSLLYQFKPDFVILSFAVQKYRERFLAASSATMREGLPQTYLNEIMAMADALQAAGMQVIINNFAFPRERMFGNYSLLSSQSLYGSVVQFNALLSEAARMRKGECHINDVMYIAAYYGSEHFFDEKLWVSSKYLCATRFLPPLAESLTHIMVVRKGRLTKCLVLDLDNTLWGGIIGDDGIDGIALGGDAYGEAFQLFQRYILALKNRGYILAVCSKNNEETALEVFRRHPEMVLREEDIALFVANWNDKASNIDYIARVLNIGLDAMVFIDDSPFERNQVSLSLPHVHVPAMPEDIADYITTLETSGLFEASGYSHEDATRNQLYREEAVRTTEQMRYSNIDDYLKSLEMKIDCGPFHSDQIPRIAQLIQRSNQFNLCTRRISEADCENMRRNPDRYVTVQARLRDKFGDYGLIAAICSEIIDRELVIIELVMSCRVLKRGVEDYLMAYLFKQCRDHNLNGIRGEYRPNPKNSMVKDFFQQLDFQRIKSDEKSDIWYLDAASYDTKLTFIEQIDA